MAGPGWPWPGVARYVADDIQPPRAQAGIQLNPIGSDRRPTRIDGPPIAPTKRQPSKVTSNRAQGLGVAMPAAGHGWPWPAMPKMVGQWPVMSSQWPASGWLWPAMAGHSRKPKSKSRKLKATGCLLLAMANNGWPWAWSKAESQTRFRKMSFGSAFGFRLLVLVSSNSVLRFRFRASISRSLGSVSGFSLQFQ